MTSKKELSGFSRKPNTFLSISIGIVVIIGVFALIPDTAMNRLLSSSVLYPSSTDISSTTDVSSTSENPSSTTEPPTTEPPSTTCACDGKEEEHIATLKDFQNMETEPMEICSFGNLKAPFTSEDIDSEGHSALIEKATDPVLKEILKKCSALDEESLRQYIIAYKACMDAVSPEMESPLCGQCPEGSIGCHSQYFLFPKNIMSYQKIPTSGFITVDKIQETLYKSDSIFIQTLKRTYYCKANEDKRIAYFTSCSKCIIDCSKEGSCDTKTREQQAAYQDELKTKGAKTIATTTDGTGVGYIVRRQDPLQPNFITFVPIPEEGSVFTGWSGACTGMEPCTLQIGDKMSVVATFATANSIPKINGVCGITQNACIRGISLDFSDTMTQYRWICAGMGGGVESTCTLNQSINGACGATTNTCVSGTSLDSADSATQYLWSCEGSYGGSRASCLIQKPTYTLTTTKTGTGAGNILSSSAGINCGTDCSEAYAENTTVTLTAKAVPLGSKFTGWSGACTGLGSCVVTMNVAKTVTATFTTIPTYTLTTTKNGTGTGTITSSVAGINCGNALYGNIPDCSETYNQNAVVTLEAIPDAGISHAGWTGCTSVSGTRCTVSMNAAKTVTATFNKPTYALTIKKAGTGTGTALGTIGSSAGFSSGSFPAGSTVRITATPATGSTFTGWTGCPSASGTICTVTMNSAQTVTANFALPSTYTVKINVSGTGTGLVRWGTAGKVTGTFTSTKTLTIQRGASFQCSVEPYKGTATPIITGDCKTSTDICSCIVNGDKTISVKLNKI